MSSVVSKYLTSCLKVWTNPLVSKSFYMSLSAVVDKSAGILDLLDVFNSCSGQIRGYLRAFCQRIEEISPRNPEISLFALLRTNLQLTHWSSLLSIMAKQHRIDQHLKKESLLKFNVTLKPKLSQSQSISQAKADPKPKLIQIQT